MNEKKSIFVQVMVSQVFEPLRRQEKTSKQAINQLLEIMPRFLNKHQLKKLYKD